MIVIVRDPWFLILLVPESASEEWHQHSDRQYPDLLIFLSSCLLLLLRKLSAVAVFLFAKHKTLDEMLQEWKGASQFIIVMDTWFERLMTE